MIELPRWMDVRERDDAGAKLTALERFILNHEPAGSDELAFREELAALVMEIEQGAINGQEEN